VRVLNATHRDHKLTRGSPLAYCEPVTLVTAPHVGQRQTQDLSSKLEDVVTATKTHLTNGELQELKEFLSMRTFSLEMTRTTGGLTKCTTA
jgi:hypothetical protein